MNKNMNNKYEQIFTPEKLTNFLLDLLEKYQKDEITEILEPCAGDGAMIKVIRERFDAPILSYDIEPKSDEIIEENFLKLKLDYKPGRVTIMNPPFTMATKFIKKVLEVSDILVCITSATTFMNLDYDRHELLDIYFCNNYEFNDGKKYPISVMVLKNK